MSDRARVLVKRATGSVETAAFTAWTYTCAPCRKRSYMFPTCGAANKAADRHARTCPALHLAQLRELRELREQVTAALADIYQQREAMRDRVFLLDHYGPQVAGALGAERGLEEASAIITDYTGIEL